MDINVFVAAHKPYRMPEDGMYIPLHVGAMDKAPIYNATDATGETISQKNPVYCELTGLYWLWRNTGSDYAGLVHYRRHFVGRRLAADKWRRVLTRSQLERMLRKTDVILPKPRHYVIESNWSQYAHAHNESDLTALRGCMETLCPDYLAAFDAEMQKTSGHRFNMMVMKRQVLDAYCAWLFPLLGALEERLRAAGGGECEPRVIGFVSERLLDVWIAKNRIPYRELPVVNMESQHWPRKISVFLQRKWNGRRK